jgi:hypothetical protein
VEEGACGDARVVRAREAFGEGCLRVTQSLGSLENGGQASRLLHKASSKSQWHVEAFLAGRGATGCAAV